MYFACDSTWLHIWNELTQTAGHQLGYANMVGNHPSLVTPVENKSGSAVSVPGKTLYIPLQFWFSRNPGENNAWNSTSAQAVC